MIFNTIPHDIGQHEQLVSVPPFFAVELLHPQPRPDEVLWDGGRRRRGRAPLIRAKEILVSGSLCLLKLKHLSSLKSFKKEHMRLTDDLVRPRLTSHPTIHTVPLPPPRLLFIIFALSSVHSAHGGQGRRRQSSERSPQKIVPEQIDCPSACLQYLACVSA